MLIQLILACLVSAPLLPAAAIYGKVVDQATGEPLRKVRVTLQGADLQAVTSDDGLYRLEPVAAGTYTLHVSTIGYRLIKKEIRIEETDSQQVDFYLGQEASTINETVRVTAPVFEEVEKTAVSQVTLNSTELKNLAGVLIDDPMRSVQTLPGVAANDDFESYYSVRGGSFQNNGIVVDGVLTHNLAHTIQGTQDTTGSFMLMNGDLVESMALFSGGFSAKYGDRTASFVDVVTREGSRDRPHVRLAVSGTNAAVVAEGPVDSSHRGSYIISARKSYVDYLVRRIGKETDLALGFTDAQGKYTYDVNAANKFGASFTWGRTTLGREPLNRGVTSLIDGENNVGMMNLSWTYIPSTRIWWENRLYLIRETYRSSNRDHEVLGSGEYVEFSQRSDLSVQASRRHRLEAGVLVRAVDDRILDRRYDYANRTFVDYQSVRGRFHQTAGYAQDRWSLVEGKLSAIVGARIDATGLTGQVAATPRASLEWRIAKGSKLDAGWGIFTQFPDTLSVLGRNGDPGLRAELARHYIAGYEQLLGEKTRLRFEFYDKEEADLPRSRDSLYRLVNGKVTPPDINFHYDNALRGSSRGFDIMVQRRSANRLAGWISYSYAHSRRHDLVTGEKYPNEFEQAHTVNVYGSYRFSESWNLSAKARFGSGFPYPGYFEERGGNFYLSTERNQERLPYYGRVDFRVNKAFYLSWGKISLYVELLNVANRENIRFDQITSVNATTKRIFYSKDTLFPILPTAGFVIEF